MVSRQRAFKHPPPSKQKAPKVKRMKPSDSINIISPNLSREVVLWEDVAINRWPMFIHRDFNGSFPYHRNPNGEYLLKGDDEKKETPKHQLPKRKRFERMFWYGTTGRFRDDFGMSKMDAEDLLRRVGVLCRQPRLRCRTIEEKLLITLYTYTHNNKYEVIGFKNS